MTIINPKSDKVKSIIKSIDYILKAITIIGGVILWFNLPEKIPTHFNSAFEPDSYGSKVVLLIAFILPLISFIPFGTDMPDRNIIPDENMYNIIVQDEYRKAAIKRLILTVIMSVIFWALIIVVIKNI